MVNSLLCEFHLKKEKRKKLASNVIPTPTTPTVPSPSAPEWGDWTETGEATARGTETPGLRSTQTTVPPHLHCCQPQRVYRGPTECGYCIGYLDTGNFITKLLWAQPNNNYLATGSCCSSSECHYQVPSRTNLPATMSWKIWKGEAGRCFSIFLTLN